MKLESIVPFLMSLILFSCDLSKPSDADILNQQGLKFLNEKKYLESRICFLKASQIRGITIQNKTEYLRNAAVAYTECFMKDSARFYYKQAAILNPKNLYTYNVNMADVHIIDSNYSSSIKCLKKAWKADSNNIAVNNTLGLMYIGEYDSTIYDPKLGLKYNEKAHDLAKSRNTKYVLAKNYFLVSDYSSSEILIGELYQEYPNDMDYLVTLILIAQRTSDKLKEEKLLQELKRKDVDSYHYLMEANNQY